MNEEEDYNTENSTGYISNASQLSDWTDAEPYEVEEETEDFEDFKDEQFLDEDEIIYVESELYDVLEEEDENSNEGRYFGQNSSFLLPSSPYFPRV